MTRLQRYLDAYGETPRYEHDCDDCVFLGHFHDVDLYFHPSPLATVVARRSDDGPDYSSGIDSSDPFLQEARSRVFRYFEIDRLRS